MIPRTDRLLICVSAALMTAVGAYAACDTITGGDQCCETYSVSCRTPGSHPRYWACQQTSSTPAGCSIVEVGDAAQGQIGQDDYDSNAACACTMTVRTCGPVYGVCVYQGTQQWECQTQYLYGEPCWGEGEG